MAGLAVGCVYLLKLVYAARAENAVLRDQIASLKRKLTRMRG
jgi:hypothetical protein